MPAPKLNSSSSIWLIVAGLVVIAALGLFSNGGGGGGSDVIPYSRFQQLLDANKVKQVTVSGSVLHGTLTDAMPDGKTSFTTVQVPPDLATQLAQHKVEFSGTVSDSGPLGTLLSWVLPPLLFVGIWMFASRAMMGGRGGGFGGGLLSVGRSKAKLVAETDVKVTFSDVAGVATHSRSAIHPLPQRLDADPQTVTCNQFLHRQCGSEVQVMFAHQAQHRSPKGLTILTVARPATFARRRPGHQPRISCGGGRFDGDPAASTVSRSFARSIITRSRVSSRSLISITPAIARYLERSDARMPQ